jgi:glycosyltransferase involved in cell wall biosynthesis
MENLLSILTPTYNRSKELPRLYDSLCTQSVRDFVWVVVDDGSTDGTRVLIQSLKTKAPFRISYIYQQNGGKHTALNTGLREISTELTMIVDSDDWLTPDAVMTIGQYHEKYRLRDDLCGFSFLRKYPDGRINGNPFPEDELEGNYIDIRINSGDLYADKAEVFYTKCLREFPFPVYDKEKFLGEDIVWMRMARRYRMIHINRAIYIGDYQPDGLTQNRRVHNIQSPLGCMHRAEEYLHPDVKLSVRFRFALQYIVYGKFAGYTSAVLLRKSPSERLTALCVIPGNILYRKWKNKYRTSK